MSCLHCYVVSGFLSPADDQRTRFAPGLLPTRMTLGPSLLPVPCPSPSLPAPASSLSGARLSLAASLCSSLSATLSSLLLLVFCGQ